MDFNINDKVRVRLTDYGREALRSMRRTVDEIDGWSEWQMWDLMHDLGAYMGNGLRLVIETTIQYGATMAPEPAPRERGQNTCRAALMTVIGMHRRENTLGPDMARAIVDATQALMDLDGLRASEAAALDVAKERDEARALADGLTRGQGDLRRKLAAMEAERDRLVVLERMLQRALDRKKRP